MSGTAALMPLLSAEAAGVGSPASQDGVASCLQPLRAVVTRTSRPIHIKCSHLESVPTSASQAVEVLFRRVAPPGPHTGNPGALCSRMDVPFRLLLTPPVLGNFFSTPPRHIDTHRLVLCMAEDRPTASSSISSSWGGVPLASFGRGIRHLIPSPASFLSQSLPLSGSAGPGAPISFSVAVRPRPTTRAQQQAAAEPRRGGRRRRQGQGRAVTPPRSRPRRRTRSRPCEVERRLAPATAGASAGRDGASAASACRASPSRRSGTTGTCRARGGP